MTQNEFFRKWEDIVCKEFTDTMVQQARNIDDYPEDDWVEMVVVELINDILPESHQINQRNVSSWGGGGLMRFGICEYYDVTIYDVCYDAKEKPISFEFKFKYQYLEN